MWCIPTAATSHGSRATLAFADDVLRRLYPTSAARDGRMTSFQLRNREHSVFRGLELLLDYRDPAIVEIPYYCPVLVYRSTTLAHYLPWLERPLREADHKTVVVEVVDLLAGMARSQRNVPGAADLVAAEREAVVRPELRRESELGLVEGRPPAPARGAGGGDHRSLCGCGRCAGSGRARGPPRRQWISRLGLHGPGFGPIRRRRIGALPVASWDRRTVIATGWPTNCGFFERFAALDRTALKLIADKCPVLRMPAGARLLDAGTRDSWNLYLLSGEVELAAPDGPSCRGGRRQPRAHAGRWRFSSPAVRGVTARTEIEFLWLYEPMVEAGPAHAPGPARFAAAGHALTGCRGDGPPGGGGRCRG
ncbi:MAG: hypothetical protein MZV70_39810 [Desulfobacterales bacterium]|nr:hypothetical protein [Desulfobacterales bacterium]